MEILFYYPAANAEAWMRGLRKRLPQAVVRQWEPGDDRPADYAMVRRPPLEMLRGRKGLKAVFSLSAGVEDILAVRRENPDLLPPETPLFRLEDAGMGAQMREYAVSTVLGWYRRFDDYWAQKQERVWKSLAIPERAAFPVGILGAGVLGLEVVEGLRPWGFPLRLWSRSPKQVEGAVSHYGNEQLPVFLSGLNVLINLLPDTPQTRGIINRRMLDQLASGAFVMNLARGAQLVEEDLLAALEAGQIKAAALDVFGVEPLPREHPFWAHPRVFITPHCAANTLLEEALDHIATGIQTLEAGGMPGGRVDPERGY